MRIISQDRCRSVEFGNIELWRQEHVIYANTGTERRVIGNYENAERAAEIFEEIHKKFSDGTEIYIMPGE